MFSKFCSAHFFYGQYVLICTFHFFIIISSWLCLISSALCFAPFYRLYVLGCASHFFIGAMFLIVLNKFRIVLRTLFSSAHLFYRLYVLGCASHLFYMCYVLNCASHLFYRCTSFISSSSETIIILVPLPALFCNLISLISITDLSLPLETSVIFVSSEDNITVLSSLFL